MTWKQRLWQPFTLALLTVLLSPFLAVAVVNLSEKEWQTLKRLASGGGSFQAPISSGTSFPVSPTTGDLFIITNDDAAGDCGGGSGTAITLCRWDGSAWTPLGDGFGTSGWPSVLTSAASTSESLPIKIRGQGGQSANGINLYQHSNGTATWVCVTNEVERDCDLNTIIGNGHYWAIRDNSNNIIVQIVPGASGMINKITFGANYHAIKSIWFSAASLYGDGTNCPSDPTAVTINSGPKIPTFICPDNNGSRLNGAVKMPNAYDGGTITLTHSYIQTDADTNALNGDVAAQCRGNGAIVNSTWGTEVPIDDAAVTGGSRNDFTKSAAITPNGTCTGAPMLYWYYELDATGTTTATATLHHVGFMLEYGVTSLSD